MKKYARLFAAASALLITAGVTIGAVQAALAGDLNGDGSLSVKDAEVLQSVLLKKSNDLKAEMDLTGDSSIDARDMSKLKYSILNPSAQPSGSIQDLGTAPKLPATMYSNFREGNAGDFFASDGWTNGSVFDNWWYKRNTGMKDGYMYLTIDQDWDGHRNDYNSENGPRNYSGGEYRTNNFYHYGYYECSMQAIKCDGVVSSFFTYTGPSDVINGQKNPWDEIDIEILGKDTTKMQINYYRNSQGGHEKMIDLGFDASEAFHTYGFDWQPNKITWYVDGR